MLELYGLVEIVSSLEESTAPTLERCGVAWERLEREEAERRFPIRVPEGAFAVLQPEAGIVRADKALAAFRRELDVREVRVRPGRARRGRRGRHRRPWVNELLDEPLPVKVTRETRLRTSGPRRSADPIRRLVQARPAHARDVLAARPGLRAQGRRAPRRARSRPRRPWRARAGADRADRRLGERDLPAGRPGAGRRRDVHVYDDRRRELHPRAARPDRRRLALLGPRLQVRPGNRRAARGARAGGRRG